MLQVPVCIGRCHYLPHSPTKCWKTASSVLGSEGYMASFKNPTDIIFSLSFMSTLTHNSPVARSSARCQDTPGLQRWSVQSILRCGLTFLFTGINKSYVLLYFDGPSQIINMPVADTLLTMKYTNRFQIQAWSSAEVTIIVSGDLDTVCIPS